MTTSSTIELTNRTAGGVKPNQAIWTESARLLYAGRIEEFLTFWSADASYEAAYPVPGMPAVITGHEALRAVFGGFGAAAETIEVRDVKFHQTADPAVAIVEERMFARLRDGGTYENRMIIRVTFRDGLIASMFEYYGELAHRELLQRLGFTH
ncbi:MAG: nuclear transport factor 2 family protein [Nakamurella sp.]